MLSFIVYQCLKGWTYFTYIFSLLFFIVMWCKTRYFNGAECMMTCICATIVHYLDKLQISWIEKRKRKYAVDILLASIDHKFMFSSLMISDVQRPVKGWFFCCHQMLKNKRKSQHAKFHAPYRANYETETSPLGQCSWTLLWVLLGWC